MQMLALRRHSLLVITLLLSFSSMKAQEALKKRLVKRFEHEYSLLFQGWQAVQDIAARKQLSLEQREILQSIGKRTVAAAGAIAVFAGATVGTYFLVKKFKKPSGDGDGEQPLLGDDGDEQPSVPGAELPPLPVPLEQPVPAGLYIPQVGVLPPPIVTEVQVESIPLPRNIPPVIPMQQRRPLPPTSASQASTRVGTGQQQPDLSKIREGVQLRPVPSSVSRVVSQESALQEQIKQGVKLRTPSPLPPRPVEKKEPTNVLELMRQNLEKKNIQLNTSVEEVKTPEEQAQEEAEWLIKSSENVPALEPTVVIRAAPKVPSNVSNENKETELEKKFRLRREKSEQAKKQQPQ